MIRLVPVLALFSVLGAGLLAQDNIPAGSPGEVHAASITEREGTQIFLVPFTLMCLVLASPLYSFVTWWTMRRLMRKRRKFTGFLTWALIIQAAVSPIFWAFHFAGAWTFVEAEGGHFDPVDITGHEVGFFALYFLMTGTLTIVGLTIVKWKSV